MPPSSAPSRAFGALVSAAALALATSGATAAAADHYAATAWVRSRRPLLVCARIREVAAHRVLRAERRCVRAGRTWRKIPTLVYAAGHSGSQVGVSFVGFGHRDASF